MQPSIREPGYWMLGAVRGLRFFRQQRRQARVDMLPVLTSALVEHQRHTLG